MALLVFLLLSLAACTGEKPLVWKPVLGTQPVPGDPDDPAIWIHPSDPARSLIIATNKVAAPDGALVVFDLEGRIVQTLPGLDRPNNVDLRQNVRLGGRTVDLVVATERNRGALRFYTVDAASRSLTPLGAAPVFAGETGDFAAPMGVALYHRGDGALFVVVGRKNGPEEGYLWQYRIDPGPALRPARKFGRFSRRGEIEAITVDDALGFVYYADEAVGIRKYHADPAAAGADRQLALFGTSGYRGDREGLAIFATGEQTGYLISTDQVAGGSRYLLYRREGAPGNPHDQGDVVAVVEGGADSTDGIEATSRPLGPRFPQGLLVAMNSGPKNFLLFAWRPPPGP